VPRNLKEKKEKGNRFKHKRRYTETLTQLSDQNIASHMVLMSSTTSSIPSGPTKAGTHNSSTAERIGKFSWDLLIIRFWQVDEMEFQCRLARFVISNKCVMRCQLAANLDGGMRGNMIHSDEEWEQLPGEK